MITLATDEFQPILFVWVDWLKTQALPHLGIVDALVFNLNSGEGTFFYMYINSPPFVCISVCLSVCQSGCLSRLTHCAVIAVFIDLHAATDREQRR